MRRTKVIGLPFGLALAALLFSATTAWAEGQERACMDCHGPEGISTESDVPIIAGASSYFLEDTMRAYQNHSRPCVESKYRSGDIGRPATDMCKIAAALSEEQIVAVSAYFASKPFVRAKQTADAGKAAIGEKIHATHCEKCHSEGGSVKDDDAGILAGQWMPYLRTSLREFADGKREMPKKMKPKFESLSPDELEALAQYYGSEH